MKRRIADSYRPERMPTNPDVIVIGSGMAGLSAASCLAQQGARVLVLERHSVPGGMTHCFHRKGFQWDVGLHYVGRTQGNDPAARAMAHVTGDGVDWVPMPDEYDRIEFPDLQFAYVRGQRKLEKRLMARYPRESAAIRGYFKLLNSAGRAMQARVLGDAASRYLGRWVRSCAGWPLRRMARSTTDEVLRGLTGNAELRAVLAGQWGNYGLTPGESSFAAHALVALHFLDGGAHPRGGSSQIARSMVPIIEAAGGRVLVKADVDRILLTGEGGSQRAVGVRMASGEEIHAGHVISAAGAHATHARLLREHSRLGASAVAGRTYSTGHFALFIGAEGSPDELGMTAANIWMYPGTDHDANRRAHTTDPNAEFPVMFVSSGAAKDPDFRRTHPGKTTLEAMVPANLDQVAAWIGRPWQRRGPDYEAFKTRLAARIQAKLIERFPRLAGAIRWSELSSPLTTNHFCATVQGELYGLGAGLDRFTRPLPCELDRVRGLEICGQDSLLFGVCGAMFSGVLSAHRIAGLPVLRDAFAPRPASGALEPGLEELRTPALGAPEIVSP